MSPGWAAGGAQEDGAISESRGFWQEALASRLGTLQVSEEGTIVMGMRIQNKVFSVSRVLGVISLCFCPGATPVLNGNQGRSMSSKGETRILSQQWE